MPFEAYIGYLTDQNKELRKEIRDGEPLVVEVRDLDTFERKIVKARVASPPAVIEGADQLWVLDWVEARQEQPWAIEILEDLSEEQTDAARSDITDADRSAAADEAKKYGGRKYRGSQMPDAIGQEEARKYYENMVAKSGKK
jgi:hypothetical protein